MFVTLAVYIMFKYTICMTIRNSEEARLALYDLMVDKLCDMYGDHNDDPSVVDDAMGIIKELFDHANIKATRSESGQIIFTADL